MRSQQISYRARIVAVVAALCATATSIISAPPAQAVDESRMIDVLVVYTTQAKNDRGSAGAIRSAIQQGITEMDNALQRSKINAGVRLIGTLEVDRVSQNHGEDLDWLRNDAGINAERDRVRADLVSLVVPGGAGLALMPSNPSASTWSHHVSVVGNDWLVPEPGSGEAGVLAHELGHNLGADHDPQTDPDVNSNHPYNKGYVSPRGQIDIMSYTTASSCSPNCRRQRYYANPRITVNGETFGDPTRSDLARMFEYSAPIVADYR